MQKYKLNSEKETQIVLIRFSLKKLGYLFEAAYNADIV